MSDKVMERLSDAGVRVVQEDNGYSGEVRQGSFRIALRGERWRTELPDGDSCWTSTAIDGAEAVIRHAKRP